MSDNPTPPTLAEAQAAVLAAKNTLLRERALLAEAALAEARRAGHGLPGDVYARAAQLLGISERTFHRYRAVTKTVTSTETG